MRGAQAGGGTAFAAELERHRTYLLRVARLQLRDEVLAEDAVQDTMLAALCASASFSGASTLRTWLTGILKHKVVDAIRKRQRRAEVPEDCAGERCDGLADAFDSSFDERGEWEAKPGAWADPERSLHQRQFFDVLALCLDHLPENTARVFVMREHMELEVPEICRELGISAANVYVILFRARAGLRRCLERKWFGDERPARRRRGAA